MKVRVRYLAYASAVMTLLVSFSRVARAERASGIRIGGELLAGYGFPPTDGTTPNSYGAGLGLRAGLAGSSRPITFSVAAVFAYHFGGTKVVADPFDPTNPTTTKRHRFYVGIDFGPEFRPRDFLRIHPYLGVGQLTDYTRGSNSSGGGLDTTRFAYLSPGVTVLGQSGPFGAGLDARVPLLNPCPGQPDCKGGNGLVTLALYAVFTAEFAIP